MFAGESVRALVNETDEHEQKPEFHDIGEGLFAEVEVDRYVGTNDIPFGDEDHGFKEKQQHRGEDHPAVVNVFSNLLVKHGEIPVRIPRRERYMGHVEA